MKVHTDNIDDVIDRWFDDADPGDWVGVFENQDLGHPDLGTRIGFVFGEEQWDSARCMGDEEPGASIAPDSSYGLGWRYLLVAKCRTRDEAKQAMGDDK